MTTLEDMYREYYQSRQAAGNPTPMKRNAGSGQTRMGESARNMTMPWTIGGQASTKDGNVYGLDWQQGADAFNNELRNGGIDPVTGQQIGGPVRGGSGSGAPTRSPLENALLTMYGQYQNAGKDTTLSDALARISQQATQTGNTAIDRLTQVLGQMQNPYTAQMAQPRTVNTNPLAAYLAANGVDSTASQSLIDMNNAEAQQTQAAAQDMQQRLAQSWQQAQQGRQADAQVSRTAFEQALANSLGANQAAIAARQQQSRDAWMQKILEMAVSNGVDLTKLGVKF